MFCFVEIVLSVFSGFMLFLPIPIADAHICRSASKVNFKGVIKSTSSEQRQFTTKHETCSWLLACTLLNKWQHSMHNKIPSEHIKLTSCSDSMYWFKPGVFQNKSMPDVLILAPWVPRWNIWFTSVDNVFRICVYQQTVSCQLPSLN